MWTEAWARQGWIISPRWDALLFLGTPLLVLAIVLPLGQIVPSDQLALYLLALFATGHHLPGFLRIYGDRELFARHPARFLLAPPLVFTIALWFAARNLHGLILATVLWDLWHSFMQHYGFMRIYAAKSGEVSRRISWLDLWVSLCWFVTIVIWSPAYSLSVVRPIVQTTGHAVPTELLVGLRWLAAVATALVTATYLAVTVRAWRRGEVISPAKLVLLVSTVGVILFAWWLLDDLVLGYAMWAVFHDIQYFAIVWVSGRGVARRANAPPAFLSSLFRAKLPLVALYVLLIFTYGSVSLVQDGLAAGVLRTVLGAYVATSTLMHYYFDGFIWKVRERATRDALGVQPVTGASAGAEALAPRPQRERLAWHGAALLLPVAFMLWLEPESRSSVHTYRALTSIYPGWGEVQFKLGEELFVAGKLEDAAQAYHEGLALEPDASLAHENLATVLERLGRGGNAKHHVRCAARLTPHDAALRMRLEQLARLTESDACCSHAAHDLTRAR